MKDKDLIKGLKNKKRSALEKVIETYSAYVNVVVYNTIGNAMSKEDMEEVISDVFISLWNNSEYIRDEGELRPYIGAVARNKSINKLRERKNTVELNEKTQIFPIRNGIDFLGFHTYLTEEGKVIRKLRHSSIKRMRSKLRRWEQDYPAGLVTREKILQSWQAWDAHAAHGNTWSLRQQVRDRVQNILKEEI